MLKRAVGRLKARWRQVGYRVAVATRRRSADPICTPYIWLNKPDVLAGENVCLLVSWCPGTHLSEHAKILGQSWASQGFRVVLIVAINNIAKFDRDQDLSFCSGVLVRENKGYDFAAWATAIRLIPDIDRVGVLVMANDSVFGPLSGFANFLGRMIESPADLVGAIGSRQNRPHTQSFLLMFKPKALLSPAFGQFWHGIRNGDREWAIVNYELKLKKHFVSRGLSVEEIFTSPSYLSNNTNPSLLLWKELVEQGFPFVKVQLLRDNPLQEDLTGWQEFLDHHEYDPEIVKRYISSLDLYR